MREDLKCIEKQLESRGEERKRERDKVFLELAHVSDKCIY